MKASLISVLALSAAAVAGAASAQSAREVGNDPYTGLHWSVAAPQGASWTLECGFAPVTIRGVHMNRINHTGSGRMAGRLPGDNGSGRRGRGQERPGDRRRHQRRGARRGQRFLI